MIIVSINTTGDVAMWSIVSVGFFNSIMFDIYLSVLSFFSKFWLYLLIEKQIIQKTNAAKT